MSEQDQDKAWEEFASGTWRGRPVKDWVRILRAHVVDRIPAWELKARERISEVDFKDAVALLWERGAVAFDRGYLSQLEQLQAKLSELQKTVENKRSVRAQLKADIAASEERDT